MLKDTRTIVRSISRGKLVGNSDVKYSLNEMFIKHVIIPAVI